MTKRHDKRYNEAVARNIGNIGPNIWTYRNNKGEAVTLEEAKHKLGVRQKDTSHDLTIKQAIG